MGGFWVHGRVHCDLRDMPLSTVSHLQVHQTAAQAVAAAEIREKALPLIETDALEESDEGGDDAC